MLRRPLRDYYTLKQHIESFSEWPQWISIQNAEKVALFGLVCNKRRLTVFRISQVKLSQPRT